VSELRTELYVYYRVAPASVPAALQAVRAFQHRLCSERPGLVARALQRSDERGDCATLMETYAFDDDTRHGLTPAMEARIERAASVLTPLLIGPRQVERFNALD